MKLFDNVILAILVFLAISSGVTKIFLMQQDVEFFGKYGFTNSVLVVYGVTQLVGGILLILPKTRIIGALVVATTFLISLVLLLIAGNIPIAMVTAVFIALLGFVIKRTFSSKNVNSSAINT